MKQNFKIILIVLILLIIGGNMAEAQGLPGREKIDDKYKWDLSKIYDSNDKWEADYKKVEARLEEFQKYQGKLSSSADLLLECINLQYEIEKQYSKLYYYAAASMHIDLNNGTYQSMYDRMGKLGSEFSAATSFISPELLEIPEEKIKKFYSDNPGLNEYKHELDVVFRLKEHMLTADQEKLLAKLSPVSSVPRNTYLILNDAELPFPTVKDDKGQDVKLSHGRYRSALYSMDRNYRERVYKGIYQPYGQLKGTIATLFNGRVKTRIIESEIRNYSSPIEAALYKNDIPVEVFYNLIETANKNAKSMHNWAEFKRQELGYDKLHPYDSYTTLYPSVRKEYTFDEAREIILEALKPLGEEYIKELNIVFDSRSIDVYETEGKRSGAYSNSCGGCAQPIILLNWNNTLDDMFTLAHELGHNLHSVFTEKEQPYQYCDYSIFVAEIASITNEALLLDYMIKNAQSEDEKAALLEKFLLNAQATFFRQTRFAEFEKIVHEKAMDGHYMNADELTREFADLYGHYWGPAMEVDYEEGLSWARIPHLIKYNFYVYQYATGFAAAQAFSEQILEEGQPAVDRYLNFLSAGSSDYPIDVLKNAGLDMSSPQPIEKTITKFNKYLEMLKEIKK